MTDNTSPQEGAPERIQVIEPDQLAQQAIEKIQKQQDSVDLDAALEPPAETDSSPEVEDEGDQDEPEEEPRKKGTPKGVQKRLDELTRDKYDAIRRAEASEARFDELMREIQQRQQRQDPQSPPSQLPNGAPNPQFYRDGELDLGFIRDLSRWETRQEFEAIRQEAIQAQAQAAVEAKDLAAKEKYPDYEEVVSPQNLGLLRNTHFELFRDMANHDQGADIAYYLGKHPEEVMALSRMSPGQAYMRLGGIIQTLTAQPEPEPKVSKANPPITPIRGGGTSPAINIEERMREAEESGNFELWQKLEKVRKTQSK